MNGERATRLSEQELTTWLDIWSVHVSLSAQLDAQLKRDAGVSHAEFVTLARLASAEAHRLRMSDLAAACEMSLSHLSRVVTRLEDQGLVRRVPDPGDGRSTLAELSDDGHAVFGDARPAHADQLRRLFFDHLDDDERREFSRAMGKLAASFKREVC